MQFLSLFAGIGGFDIGLERAGMTCVGQVEIDPKCQAVLAKHWPDVKRFADIRAVQGDEFGHIDLICGGYPCQPFSTSGKRKGKDDVRYLWPEMLRLIKTVKPTWVIGENVAGHITCGLDEVLNDLEKESYETRAFLLPASAIGAPHERKRVFIVANLCSGNTRKGLESITEDVHRNGKGEQAYMPSTDGGSSLCDGNEREKLQFRHDQRTWWEIEPGVGRVVYGVPAQPHRFKQLGNAVVPQLVETIGKCIMEIQKAASVIE